MTVASKIQWETNTAVNMLATRLMISVTAYPLIGPVPNWKRKTAEMTVVRFESKMVLKAREKPTETEFRTICPGRSPPASARR